MSAKIRKQQDCEQYLEMWDKCKIEIEKQEKIALSKLKETANRMQKERDEFDQSFLPDDVQQKIEKIRSAMKSDKHILATLPDSLPDPWTDDGGMQLIIITGIGFAIGFMVIAYGFLGWTVS